MFKSLLGLTGDVVKVATAPIEVAADLTRAAVKPIVEVAEDVVKDVKELTDD